uniref:E4 n=1 Tax=Human papillomavirus type 18 TaxID=333761 RepID=A9XFI6_HPV18|nr:E4 [human papillomavirus 18]AGU90395.1 E4 [human papillomavirus 18]AGU90403.1 E4 [human papillomavirus 18]AGU90411.1 E4 [human papillomavirus 18]
MTLCAVPVTTRYPLLSLLNSYSTPPHRIPAPCPWAPQRPTARRRLLQDLDTVDLRRRSSVDLSTHFSVQLQATTKDGNCVVVTLRL